MKKHLLSLAVLIMGTALFTACSDSDDNKSSHPVAVSNGFYVVCSGNTSSSIDGSLTYFDYTTAKATPNAFRAVNGKSLGMTVNDAVRYGDKLYIVVDGEHKVFVTDAKTLKQITMIDMTSDAMLGAEGGAHPRRLTGADGNIYVSTYGGFVAAIDTISFSLKQKYQVGSYPEGLAISNGILYVANSDYGMGLNPSISKITLSTGAVSEVKDANIRNPQEIAVAGSDIYFLDYGRYDDNWNQLDAGVYCISQNTVKCVVPNATAMAAAGYNIYTINAPYGQGETSYSIYNIQSGTLTKFTPAEIEYPACIGVDPITNNVMIASYRANSGWAEWKENGYVNIYDPTVSKKLSTFDCGVGPQRFSCNIGIRYIVY